VKEINATSQGISKEAINPAEFEKDDDSNFHIDFINATANLRATNYQIKNCDRQKTKMIAGKIVPAIATTTAMITGVVSAEIYKFAQGFNKIEDFRNAFINLALPMFLFSEPFEVGKIKSKDFDPITLCKVKAIPEDHTKYDKIEVDLGSITFQQLFAFLEEKYNVEVSLVTAGQYSIYNAYQPGSKMKERLTRKIEEVYNEVSEIKLPASKKQMQLEIGGACKDEEDCDF
jgi:ubiquitin-activating enzyme E1